MMKPWSPSNGSEQMWFVEKFCDKCARETWNPRSDKGRKCSVLNKGLLGYKTDEWIYGEDGKPTCTAFKLPSPRKKPDPKIPGQLTFWYETEKMKTKYKPGPGWKKLSTVVYEKGVFRIHTSGLIRSMILGTVVNIEQKASRYIKINGGNRKRGLMAYANHVRFGIW